MSVRCGEVPLAFAPPCVRHLQVDREAGELVADFYTNIINEKGEFGCAAAAVPPVAVPAQLQPSHLGPQYFQQSLGPQTPTPTFARSVGSTNAPGLPWHAGLACDPVTGEVISCKPGAVRTPARTWRGRTAKALSVEVLERDHGFKPCTHLEHANYLGRELQRAEFALVTGAQYVQD